MLLFAVFGRVLKYGTVSDYGAHKESCQDLLLFYSHKQGKLISLKEYVDAMPEGQEKIYYAPGENKELLAKLPQVTLRDGKGYDPLLFTSCARTRRRRRRQTPRRRRAS